MPGGASISDIDIKLAHAGSKRFVGGPMAQNGGFLRLSHARKFIIGFVSAVEVQIVQYWPRIDSIHRQSETFGSRRRRAKVSDPLTRRRQQPSNLIGVIKSDNINK